MKIKNKIILSTLLLMIPMVAFSDVFGKTGDAMKETGSMVGGFLFLAVSAIWVLPLVFGGMVYSGQKKKAEQQHEEVGMKAALYSLVAIIIGASAAYYVVGTIGELASKTDGKDAGNAYFLKTFFDNGTKAIKGE